MNDIERRKTARLRLTGIEPFDEDSDDAPVFRFLGYTLLVGGLCVSLILWLDLLVNP